MDPISKELSRLTEKDRKRIKDALSAIDRREVSGLNLKKLKGYSDLFRVRVGPFRINLRRTPAGFFYVIDIMRRTTTTYRKKR